MRVPGFVGAWENGRVGLRARAGCARRCMAEKPGAYPEGGSEYFFMEHRSAVTQMNGRGDLLFGMHQILN